MRGIEAAGDDVTQNVAVRGRSATMHRGEAEPQQTVAQCILVFQAGCSVAAMDELFENQPGFGIFGSAADEFRMEVGGQGSLRQSAENRACQGTGQTFGQDRTARVYPIRQGAGRAALPQAAGKT